MTIPVGFPSSQSGNVPAMTEQIYKEMTNVRRQSLQLATRHARQKNCDSSSWTGGCQVTGSMNDSLERPI